MSSSSELTNKLNNSNDELFATADGLNANQLQFKPAEKGWSVIECLEHIVLINQRVAKIIATPPTAESAENIVNEKSELFGAEKLNHILVSKREALKVDAPEFSVPVGHFKTFVEIKTAVNELTGTIANYLQNHNIALETQTIKHLRLGEMTKTDWLNFMVAHTKRHLIQAEAVKTNVAFPI